MGWCYSIRNKYIQFLASSNNNTIFTYYCVFLLFEFVFIIVKGSASIFTPTFDTHGSYTTYTLIYTYLYV